MTTIRDRVLTELAGGPLTFYTLAARLVAPLRGTFRDEHESFRATFLALIDERVIVPAPASSLFQGALLTPYRLADAPPAPVGDNHAAEPL